MRCISDNAIPPVIFNFTFEDTEGEKFDLNTKLAEVPLDVRFSRYTLTRVNDEMTILVVKSLQTDDAGVVKCSAHNRANPEVDGWVWGTTAEVIVEDKCVEGAKFCFDGGVRDTVSVALMICVTVILAVFRF
eukprot:sb/3474989/